MLVKSASMIGYYTVLPLVVSKMMNMMKNTTGVKRRKFEAMLPSVAVES
jgi:hypothetical protein